MRDYIETPESVTYVLHVKKGTPVQDAVGIKLDQSAMV